MTTPTTIADSEPLLAGSGWRDGIEAGVRGRIRSFIEAMLEEELEAALGRARYVRQTAASAPGPIDAGLGNEEAAVTPEPTRGHRHGRRQREIVGTFGAIDVAVPRARLLSAGGTTTERQNKTLQIGRAHV